MNSTNPTVRSSSHPTIRLSPHSIVGGLGHPALRWLALLSLLSTINYPLSTLHALGTAFTYQGRLNDGGSPATGIFDLRFTLYNASTAGTAVGGPLTNAAAGVTNGLFAVTLDFGAGVFNGDARWLEIGVRSNGAAADFTVLSPRQPVLPVPYAIMANSASNLLGTLPAARLTGGVANGQLANSSITVNAGSGLSGGGTVSLGGSTTLSNAGVLSVAGNSDITASTAGGVVTLGDSATSNNVANTIVKRDPGGSFSAGSPTLNGNLAFPSSATIYSGGNRFLHSYGSGNLFAGPSAGNFTTTGYFNAAAGGYALCNNTSGSLNAAMGYNALCNNSSGSDNTANGFGALQYNTIGSYNAAIGYDALA